MKDIKLAITAGDHNGVGYELLFKTLSDEYITNICTPIIYGSIEAAKEHLRVLDDEVRKIQMQVIKDAADAKLGSVNFIDCYSGVPVQFGKRQAAVGEAAFKCLNRAIQDWKDGKISALVTCPICKETIQNDQFPFHGHTEWLEHETQTEGLMMMVSDYLKVGLVTNHISLGQLSQVLTSELIERKIRLMHQSLVQDFSIHKPRIAVLGLNPHAGDGGLLGTEETELINPVIKKLASENMLVFGSYPADGFWGSGKYKLFDGVIALYHDQGLIPFKLLDMSGVNFTAGLPLVRTSPDHGTCFDIAGKNEADPTSLRHAIWTAIDILH